MTYHLQMPFHTPEWSPDAQDVLDRLVAHYEQKQHQNQEIDKTIGDDVRLARSKGVTLQQIAERLGVSRETIRKMGAAK